MLFSAAAATNANAAGGQYIGVDGANPGASSEIFVFMAVGYPDEGAGGTAADQECRNHPRVNTCFAATSGNVTDQHVALYSNLATFSGFHFGFGANAAAAQAMAAAQCPAGETCDCLVAARDFTENARPTLVVMSYTMADSGNTPTCDTVVEPTLLLNDAVCNTMMPGSEGNEDEDMCIFTENSCSTTMPGSTVNGTADGCTYTDDSCSTAMAGSEANGDNTDCTFTPQSCNAEFPGSTATGASDDCTFTDESCSVGAAGRGANDDNTACEFSNESCDASVDGPGPDANANADGCAFTNEQCGMIMAGAEAINDRCECPDDSVDIEIEGATATYCVDFQAPAENSSAENDLYMMDNCTGAEWLVAYELNTDTPAGVVAELCAIPYQVGDPQAPSGGGGLTPLQVPPGNGDNCVMRTNGAATPADPLCSDDGLFGGDGFPDKPMGFDDNPNNRLMIVGGVIMFDGAIVERFMQTETGGEQPVRPGTGGVASSEIGDNDDARMTAYIGTGVFVVGLAAYYLWDGNANAFAFSPDVGYAVSESGYSYNFGGRLDFRQDNWHLYYAAGQANSNGEFGDFRYESGGEYSADFWTAAFSETVQGETADYNFSLSADWESGIWQVSPKYRLHSRFTDEEFETANTLNLEGVLRYNRWTISPSAGFRWESADEFGDNARFNLSAVRRF
ncbi:MAG: hypothetical protein ACR2QC_11390 [Gammaproteobacteria bacterium]